MAAPNRFLGDWVKVTRYGQPIRRCFPLASISPVWTMFEPQARFAMLAPKGAPTPTLSTLRKTAGQSLNDPEVMSVLKHSHLTPSTPEEASNLESAISSEYDRWGAIIRARGIQLN